MRRPEFKEFSAGLLNFSYEAARLRDLLSEMTLGQMALMEKVPESLAGKLGVKLHEGFHPLAVALADLKNYYSIVGAKQIMLPELLKTFPAQTKALGSIKDNIITAARTGQMSLDEFDRLYQVTQLQKTLEKDTFELLKVVFPELGDQLTKEMEKQTKETSKIARGLQIVAKPFEGFLYAAFPFFYTMKKLGFGKLFGLFKRIVTPKKKPREEIEAKVLEKLIGKLAKKYKIDLPDIKTLTGVSPESQEQVLKELTKAIKKGEFGEARAIAEKYVTKAEVVEEQERAKEAKAEEAVKQLQIQFPREMEEGAEEEAKAAKEQKKIQKFAFRDMISSLFKQSKTLGKLSDLTGKGTQALQTLSSKGFLLPILKGALIAALIAGAIFFAYGPGKKMLSEVLKAILPKELKFLGDIISKGISAAIKAPLAPFIAPLQGLKSTVETFTGSLAAGEGLFTAVWKAGKEGLSTYLDEMTLNWFGKEPFKWIYEKVVWPFSKIKEELARAKDFIEARVISPIKGTFESVIQSITSIFGWFADKVAGVEDFISKSVIGKVLGIAPAEKKAEFPQIVPPSEVIPPLPSAAPNVIVQPASQSVSIDIEALRRELAYQNNKLDIIAGAASRSQNLQAENLKMKKDEQVLRGLRDIYSSDETPVMSVF